MYDAFAAQKELAAKIAELDNWTIRPFARPDELNGTAEHMKAIGKLVADYFESIMADASASVPFKAIFPNDARTIEDCASDCAGQLHHAAEKVEEVA